LKAFLKVEGEDLLAEMEDAEMKVAEMKKESWQTE
jgi:hypothetical protein